MEAGEHGRAWEPGEPERGGASWSDLRSLQERAQGSQEMQNRQLELGAEQEGTCD